MEHSPKQTTHLLKKTTNLKNRNLTNYAVKPQRNEQNINNKKAGKYENTLRFNTLNYT